MKTILTILSLLLFCSANSMPPFEQNEKNLQTYQDILETGVCSADNFITTIGPFKVLAVLVKFSDKPNQVSKEYFDSLVFSQNGISVRNYFSEISYGQLDLITVNLPSELDWNLAPQTYNYYVDSNFGFSAYPHNTQKLTEDIVDSIDSRVNFSQYDNNLDGFVDVLLIIHAGSGAELTGNQNDIWSHKWSILPRIKDGVKIANFTIQPEYWYNPNDMTIGVYSHELCHGFGLPDLYDTDYSSYGIGRWDIMSYGSWNGNLGSSPSHPSAWSRIQMGFTTSSIIGDSLLNFPISPVNNGGIIYKLMRPGINNEYFLLENRKKIGYDISLPNAGLLIWHIDNSKPSNNQEWYPGLDSTKHFKVALEQADGLFSLEKRLNQGDQNDVYPGVLNKTEFTPNTIPSSNLYFDATDVYVRNIRKAGDTIYIDLIKTDSNIINNPPVMDSVPDKNIDEAQNLSFNVSASDLDSTIPSLSILSKPSGAIFTDNEDGTGNFSWTPNFTQSGVYNPTFRAFDGIESDLEEIIITVNNIPQPPVLNSIGNRTTIEGFLLSFNISASDIDGTIPSLHANNMPYGASLTDSGNGKANFNWISNFNQSGIHNILFWASDGSLNDSEMVIITVNNNSCCQGIRGDINQDGFDNTISDLVYLVNFIFRGGQAPSCPEEADLVVDGKISTLDLNFLVNKVFRGGPNPPQCQ